MNRIVARFAALKEQGETAFVPFITAGDPTLARTEEIILALAEAGSDVIELGVPFSDPVGDGPVIQDASMRALKNHVTMKDVLALVKRVREKTDVPILLFSYFNPILVYGIEQLAIDAADAGADGFLFVDLPAEEATDYRAELAKHDLCTVFLTAPTTSDERLVTVGEQCTGFVYYVCRMGVTGEQAELVEDLQGAVDRVRHQTQMPVAVGFGISKPEHARQVAGMAEGVVVGSAIVRLIGEKGDTPETVVAVLDFAKSLVDATKGR